MKNKIVGPLCIASIALAITFMTLREPKVEFTLSDYNEIYNGMSHDKVIEILKEGEEKQVEGLENIDAKMYHWTNSDGSLISIVIKDGVVNSKFQHGLE